MFKKSLVLSMLMSMTMFVSGASAAYMAVPGDLLRTADDATVVLVMDNLQRVPISADGFAKRYNNDFSRVKVVTLAERGSFSGDALNHLTSLTSGTVFMYELNQPGIYLVDNGFKRLFMTWTGFEANGHNFNDVIWVGDYTMYPTGAPVQ